MSASPTYISEGPQCSSIAVAVRITRPVRPRERGALSETAERAPRMRGRSHGPTGRPAPAFWPYPEGG